MLIDSPYIATPGKKFKLKDYSTDDIGDFKDRDDATPAIKKNLERLDHLQQRLYAGGKHAMLIVIQAMDTGGKDGAIDHVFSGVNPQGCFVTSFKIPSHLELSHDFLWRYHQATPPRGMIGIFNRSHYESVLVERVKNIVPKKVWHGRYDHINAWEKMLSDEGTLILKFFLHISKDEQKRRLEARIKDPDKHWKFNPGDLADRKLWDEYQGAYEDAIENCSTKHAPWIVVPSDHKWFRNWVLSDTIVQEMEKLDLRFPAAVAGLNKIKVK